MPVRIDGRLAGAVAVSGATSIQDHEIAERAAAAVSGLRAAAGQPASQPVEHGGGALTVALGAG